MDVGVGRQYGNAEIGGNATVHQGDTHTSTALNISPGNTIHISVQGNLEWFPVARKRLLDAEDCERNLCTTKRKRLHNSDPRNRLGVPGEIESKRLLGSRDSKKAICTRFTAAQDQNLREQGIHLVNQVLQSSCSRERVSFFSHEHADVHHVHALHHLHSTLRRSTKKKRGILLTLVDNIRQNSLFPALANVFPNSSAVAQQKACQEAIMFPRSTEMIAPTTGCGPAQDLVCVFLAMLAMLSCREASHGNNTTYSALTPSASKVSLIAGLITFALARYFCLPSMLQQMSEWAGGSLVILDPFMRELRVPKAHVEHFTLLEAFLRVKLSGTTAEAFVEAGQFNLTLGQRHGHAIRKTDWSAKGRIKSDQRVVMAVSLRRQDATCIECQEQLTMAESGQFACHLCGKVYGNCASLKYLTDTVRANIAAYTPNKRRSEVSKPVPDGVQVGDDEGIDDDYDLYGLQNIDLHILRKKGRHPLGSRPTMEEADHLDSTPPRSGVPQTARAESITNCICSYDNDDVDVDKDDNLTVFCEKCNTWQHIACFYHQTTIPETHLCMDCALVASSADIDAAQERQRQKKPKDLRKADKVAQSVDSLPVERFHSLVTSDDSDDAAKGGKATKPAEPSKLMTVNRIWDRLASMEKFRNGEIDIDNLCSELRAKAKVSERGVVVEEKHVNDLLGWDW